ncbi:AMP-binding protein [Yeosuana marina]|uniref:AMP-binding protein n=1 Tax=Yeosuana marina TaxID=1565536 RepID=UPI0030EC152E
MEIVIQQILQSIKKYPTSNAFFIDNTYYTYIEFSDCISKIQYAIQKETSINETNVGLITNNDLETYATIIALWLEGKAYVPMNPETPFKRNVKKIKQAKIKTIIDSDENNSYHNYNVIHSKKLLNKNDTLVLNNYSEDNLAYIIFTSGTTGKPKGVPITHHNLNHFIDAMWLLKYDVKDSDKCLQMFELTFDFSVITYLAPLLKGACIYTTSKNKIKYLEVYKLIIEHKLTILPLVPSIIHYLRPFFKQIMAPWVRFSIFCGEALHLDVVNEWYNSTPSSKIINFYGPTEATVFCTYYRYNPEGNNKTHNGIICIGKAMKNTDVIIIDENNKILQKHEKGELCIAGDQLTNGYWENDKLNQNAFFDLNHQNKIKRFYKTGDLCFFDDSFDIMYLGRVDFQAKIQGFRVELSEIEFHTKHILKSTNVIAVVFENKIGNTEIGLAIESEEFDIKKAIDNLKSNVPIYMVPTKIKFLPNFPLNMNGKTDRKKITEIFESHGEK